MLTVKNQTRGWNKGDKNELEKPKKRRIRVYYYTGEFHHFSFTTPIFHPPRSGNVFKSLCRNIKTLTFNLDPKKMLSMPYKGLGAFSKGFLPTLLCKCNKPPQKKNCNSRRGICFYGLVFYFKF
jgi:hypothetical protein